MQNTISFAEICGLRATHEKSETKKNDAEQKCLHLKLIINRHRVISQMKWRTQSKEETRETEILQREKLNFNWIRPFFAIEWTKMQTLVKLNVVKCRRQLTLWLDFICFSLHFTLFSYRFVNQQFRSIASTISNHRHIQFHFHLFFFGTASFDTLLCLFFKRARNDIRNRR